MQKYPFSDGQTRLKQIIDEADVLLPLNNNAPYFVNDADKTKQIIGFKQTDERENKQFRDLITQGIGINSDVVIPLQSKNEILIIKEFAGFPLRIVNGLKELKDQYERQKHLYDGYNLHNESQTFFLDIIPPEGRKMELLQDNFYTCLAFGKIQKDSQTNIYYLQLEDELRNEFYDLPLSNVWEESLEEISQNETVKEYLQSMVTDLEEELKQNPDLFPKVYYPRLINFIDELEELTEYDLNFSQKKFVLGERADRTSMGKNGILKRIYERFLKIVNDAQKEAPVNINKTLSSSNSLKNQALLTAENGKNTNGVSNDNELILEVDEDIEQSFRKKWEGVNMQKVFDLHDKKIIDDETLRKIIKLNGC